MDRTSRDDGLMPAFMAAFSEPVLIASRGFPPVSGGTPVIMKNLLDGLSPGSVVLATCKPLKIRYDSSSSPHERHYVAGETLLPGRLERVWRLLSRPLLTRRLVRLGRRYRCGAVVGVYPDLLFLDASERAARILGVPFFPYLHDTVAEAASSSRFALWARKVQERVFKSATRVFVATRGMAELYRRKYGLDAVALVHIYPEEVPVELPPELAERQTLLWAGNAYSINSSSFLRVFEAMKRVGGLRLTMATGQAEEDIEALGFDMNLVDQTYIPVSERPKYLDLIRGHAVLVLALNWPDETHIHEDELATIFPTKTPEYLASGRPIIVHCPEHYHLARFFSERGCGEVVSERSVEAVEGALVRILASEEYSQKLGEAGLLAAKEFASGPVIRIFSETVEAALRGKT